MVVYSYKLAPTVSSLWEDGRRVLGSYDVITDANGNVVERLSFDAWGNRRNPIDWREKEAPGTPHLFSRGFTGHEHLDKIGAINMNGRLYDPALGRFFSPDPFVADAASTQGFNRYSYANNCPTMYIDPSGEIVWFIPIIIGAVVGGYTGYKVAEAKGYDIGNLKTWGYMLGGAVIGGVSGYMGATIATGGGFMANTMAIVGSSYVNSVGMAVLSDGMIQPSVSFGAASYNFGIGEWGYLGKKGNKWYQNMGYGFGALANLADLNQVINSTLATLYTDNSDFISHNAIVKKETGEPLMSFGPNDSKVPNTKLGYATYFRKSTSYYTVYKTLPVDITVNEHIIGLVRMLGKILHFQGVTTNCVNMASLSLWLNGIPNIGIHPYLLYATTWAYSSGIRPDLFSYYFTNQYKR